jgi:hypothetical protein
LVNESGDDLVKNLQGLEPALRSLADIGPEISQALIFASAFPYGPAFADKITKGDYINLKATFDLTYPRLKRGILLGTRWGDENAKLIPAPGDPYFMNYAYDPIMVGVAPPPSDVPPVPETAPGQPVATMFGPVLPMVPPPPARPQFGPEPQLAQSQIFAGPFGAEAAPPEPPAPAPAAPPAGAELPAPPAGGGG